MYRPRISKLHDNLVHDRRLHVTAMDVPLKMDLRSEVEIGVYAGSMFFKSEAEQNAFCGFLGLIPQPRTQALENAFRNELIEANGFVPSINRKICNELAACVGECHFKKNPVGLVISLIGARHQLMRRQSHVASIVDRGVKLIIETMEQDDADVIMVELSTGVQLSNNNNIHKGRKRLGSRLSSVIETPSYWKQPKLEPGL